MRTAAERECVNGGPSGQMRITDKRVGGGAYIEGDLAAHDGARAEGDLGTRLVDADRRPVRQLGNKLQVTGRRKGGKADGQVTTNDRVYATMAAQEERKEKNKDTTPAFKKETSASVTPGSSLSTRISSMTTFLKKKKRRESNSRVSTLAQQIYTRQIQSIKKGRNRETTATRIGPHPPAYRLARQGRQHNSLPKVAASAELKQLSRCHVVARLSSLLLLLVRLVLPGPRPVRRAASTTSAAATKQATAAPAIGLAVATFVNIAGGVWYEIVV